MTITRPSVVALTWTLRDAQGEEIDALTAPVEFLVGGDDLLAKVEDALVGQDTGFSTTLHLEPEDAFGDYDPALVFFEERKVLPENIVVGMQFEGLPPGATTPDMPPDAIYTVTEAYAEHVVFDGNHPLAGIALRLALTVHEVREATDDEVDAGTVGTPAISVIGGGAGGAPLH